MRTFGDLLQMTGLIPPVWEIPDAISSDALIHPKRF
jgi:hypothetical protein